MGRAWEDRGLALAYCPVRNPAKSFTAARATHTAADGFEVKRGQRVPSQGNIRLAMERLGISLRFDAFNDRMLIDGHAEDAGEAVVDDAIANQLWLRIEEEFGFRSTREYFYIVVEEAARRNTFHPVLDYLDGLEWDGTKRLDGWLTIYCGVTDTEYARAVGAITLIAAVRRVRRPGVKFDEMLVLEGPQGLNKSELLKALAVNPDWFSDDLPLNADGKRVIEQTRGKWIIEAAEMSGIRKTEVEHLKAMLSRQTDRGRLAYDRMTSEKNRQFIVFGTTNDATYLRDATGNRRFWPVRISGCNVDDLRADADQLWAEVAKREAAGASIRLHQSLWAAAAAEQAERVVDDPWFEIMAEVFGNLNGRVLAAELWRAVDVRAGDQDPGRNKRLGDVMRALGFERKKLRKSAGGWGYRRPPGDVPENKPWIEIAYDSPAMRWRAHVSDDGVADAAE